MQTLNKIDIVRLSEVTGFSEKEVEELFQSDQIKLFGNMEEFVRWYFEDNEGYAVDALIEWFIYKNEDFILKPKEFLADGLNAIPLDDKVAYVFE